MRIWVAGVEGGWSSERMVQALKKLRVSSRLITLSDCSINIGDGTIRYNGEDLSGLDGLIVRKLGDAMDPLSAHRVHILYKLAAKGVRVFSPPAFIEMASNRYRMSLELANAGIQIPPTIVTESADEAISVVESWGKAVLKPIYTSKGRGMVLLDRDKAFHLALKRWEFRGRAPFYLQKFIESEYDIGVALTAGSVVGAFKRVRGRRSWQTTIRTGGHYEPFSPDSRVEEIINKVARRFVFDYTVIDLVPQGKDYLVYEISAFGGFSGLFECGIDAAALLARHAVTTISLPKRKNVRTR